MSVLTGKNNKFFRRELIVGGMAVGLVACSEADEVSSTTDSATTPDPITTASTELPQSNGDVDMAEVLKPSPLKEMSKGDENAPVTIVEYMSMTCPHCRSFHQNTYGEIEKKYVDTGKVRFIVREFPFDPRAAAAAMLARCAPEEQFFPMIDVLFQQQSSWARSEDARGELLKLAKLAGFTQESFNECLTNQQLLDDVTEVRNRGANDYGIQSTPSFIINGKRYSGDMSVETMSALIDSLL